MAHKESQLGRVPAARRADWENVQGKSRSGSDPHSLLEGHPEALG